MKTLVNHSFNTEKIIEGDSEGTYKLLCPSDDKCFLVLQILQKKQNIFKYDLKEKQISVIKTFPRHPFVVSATISRSHDFLIVVFYSINNGFTKKKNFFAMCYSLTNPGIQHPICNISETYPRIDFSENSNKFFVLVNGCLETWEMQITNDDFVLTKSTKTTNGVIWWELRAKQVLEYVKKDASGDLFMHSNTENTWKPTQFLLPKTKVEGISFLHLKGREKQDVLFVYNGKIISCSFPHSGEEFVVTNTPPAVGEFDTPLIDSDFLSCHILNDFVFIRANNNNIVCILIDINGIPRSAFSITYSKNSELSYIKNISTKNMEGVDLRNGSLVSLSFDYKTIILENSTLFQPLIHFAGLNEGLSTNIFKFVTFKVLEEHWANPIFDEYFITLMKRSDCFTFCEVDSVSHTLFFSTDSNKVKKNKPKTWRNLGQLFRNEKQVLVDIKHLVRDIPSDLLYFGLLQYFVDLIWVEKTPEVPPDFLKHVYPKIDVSIAEMWVFKGIAPFEVLSIKGEDIAEDAKWWSKRSKRRSKVIPVATPEPISFNDQLKAFAKNEHGKTDDFIINVYKEVLCEYGLL